MPKLAAMTLALTCFAAVPLRAQTPRMPDGPSIRAFGFGDANFVTTARDDQAGFVLGQLVGHVSAALTNRLSFSSEVSATGRAAGYTLEIERMIVRYDFADPLKLSVGRYHTPISYWNTAFHHGLWLQTTVARPQMIRFGSRFMPVHFVGVLAEGTLPTGPLGLGYTLGLGNGRQSDNIARAGDAGDSNDKRAWTAGLLLHLPEVLGLQLGGNIYSDEVTRADTAIGEQIISGHLVLARESPELLAEYARVRHDAGAAGTTESTGYYVQIGYRLPGQAHAFKPYLRLERVDVAANDPLLARADVEYAGAIVGLRLDFTDFAALKAEYRNDRVGLNERMNSLWLQVSFAVSGGGGEQAMHTVLPARRWGPR